MVSAINEARISSAAATLKQWAGVASGGSLLAILDAAVNETLIERLYANTSVQFDVLARGDVAADEFYQSPFLVDLTRQPDLLNWVLSGWSQAWGIFVLCAPPPRPEMQRGPASEVQAELTFDRALRHLRGFTQARTEVGNVIGLRFYDPRVFGVLMHHLTAEQWQALFDTSSVLSGMAFEPAVGFELQRCELGANGLAISSVPLAAG